MRTFIVLLVLVIVFSLPVVADSGNDSLITANTEPPVLLNSYGRNFAYTEAEYNKIMESRGKVSFMVPITRKPDSLSPNARFGYNIAYGGRNRSWVLDGDEQHSYTLYLDLNADGDLTNDMPLKFVKEKEKYSVLLKAEVTETLQGVTATYPLVMKLEVGYDIDSLKKEKQLELYYYNVTQRKGVIPAEGMQLPFTLTGQQGIYDYDYNRVAFDLNGDGKFSSGESYEIREKYINIGNGSYEFIVDRYGRSLTLKLLPEHRASRPTLEPGSTVPEFSFKDMNDSVHSMSEYRGKVVLLDNWGYWCGPCVEEVPELKKIYDKFHEKGFDVIGIHNGVEKNEVQKFIDDHQMPWLQTLEQDGGPIQKLFRINGYPTYYLINKDGIIISNSIRPGDELIRLIDLQYQNQ